VGPRAGLGRCGKSRPHRDSTPDRPARSQTLYRLSYPAHSRGIVLLFLDHGTRRGEESASRPGRSLPLRKTRYPLYRRLGGPRAGLYRCGKSRPHRDSILGPSSP